MKSINTVIFSLILAVLIIAGCGGDITNNEKDQNPNQYSTEGNESELSSTDESSNNSTNSVNSNNSSEVPVEENDNYAPECTSGNDCNDGIDCTEDLCNEVGQCIYNVVPARCDEGQVCNLKEGGCTEGLLCNSDEDCIDDDICTENEWCDMATHICLFDTLDSDDDGYPPIVCGGTDCDDSKSNVFPGAEDYCNGIDNNCDGNVDSPVVHQPIHSQDPEIVELYEEIQSTQECVDGNWVCKEEYSQEGGCCSKNMMEDDNNCGACNNSCGNNESCISGECRCDYDPNPELNATTHCSDRTEHIYGECEYGIKKCQPDGTWGECEGEILPTEEICDGLDNNCNGQDDDMDIVRNRTECSVGIGQCKVDGYYICHESSLEPVCALDCTNVSRHSENYEEYCGDDDYHSYYLIEAKSPIQEVCNGLDDDCDGQIDEDFDFVNDSNNCGDCNVQCSSNEICHNSQCWDNTPESNNNEGTNIENENGFIPQQSCSQSELEIFNNCINNCSDFGCHMECFGGLSIVCQIAFESFARCINQSDCESSDTVCIENVCFEEVYDVFGTYTYDESYYGMIMPSYNTNNNISCTYTDIEQLNDCTVECGTDYNCWDNCRNDLPPDCKQAYQEYVACFHENCPSDGSPCQVAVVCSDEYHAVFGHHDEYNNN